jgi:serine/threonine protein kinase
MVCWVEILAFASHAVGTLFQLCAAKPCSAGTFAWAAPEVLTNQKCTEKADMFSFGMSLL